SASTVGFSPRAADPILSSRQFILLTLSGSIGSRSGAQRVALSASACSPPTPMPAEDPSGTAPNASTEGLALRRGHQLDADDQSLCLTVEGAGQCPSDVLGAGPVIRGGASDRGERLEVRGARAVLVGEVPLGGVDLVIAEIEVDDGLHVRDEAVDGDRIHAVGTAHSDRGGLVVPVERRHRASSVSGSSAVYRMPCAPPGAATGWA